MFWLVLWFHSEHLIYSPDQKLICVFVCVMCLWLCAYNPSVTFLCNVFPKPVGPFWIQKPGARLALLLHLLILCPASMIALALSSYFLEHAARS